MRRITPADADALMRFYNGLSSPSKRTFHPLGPLTDRATCEQIAGDNAAGDAGRYDLIVQHGEQIVGWCFICGLNKEPSLGLGIADAHQGRKLGRALVSAVMHWARARRLPAVHLTVVHDNAAARRLYESFGFVVRGEHLSEEDGLSYCHMTTEVPAKAKKQ